jgi:biotin carboxylase
LLLAERPLSGVQVTLDGYVYDGEVVTVGVVDSIMYPGTLAFQRFEYPSALPAEAQDRMSAVAAAVMAELEYGDGQFNMEFMFDSESDRIAIIEINPRMSSQFADLYEKVDGTNGYSTMLNIARGVRPDLQRRAGRHGAAASCVLRTFKNQRVVRAPAAHEIEGLQRSYPDMRIEIFAQEGAKLSQQLQDGNSYRYAVLNIGARDRQEILEILEDCRRRLTFIFEPV